MEKQILRSNDLDVMKILDKLGSLEKISSRLEPDLANRKSMASTAIEYVDAFVDSQKNAAAYRSGNSANLTTTWITPGGKSFDEMMKTISTEVNEIGINSSSGRCFAYIPGGGIWVSAIADFLAAATNRYAGVYFSSPGAVIVENQMIRWLCDLVGYPSSAHGNLTSGGSIANLVAVQIARDRFKIDSANVRSAVIYTTAHTHHCIDKSIHTCGLSEAEHRIVPMNSRYQMDPDALENLLSIDASKGLRPFLVVATAGSTDTGAVDPLDQIANACNSFGAWFHVDAAYGGFFMLVDSVKKKFKGIERSDSLVIDPHKGMFLPFGSGVVLVRDRTAMIESFSSNAAYMQDAVGFDEVSPSDTGPELSRHFRGLRMWLPLHIHGEEPFKACLEEKLLLCRYFYDKVRALGFETGPEPELSVALFRYPDQDADDFNRRLLLEIQKDGRCLFSSTSIEGRFWIRSAILNFRSHLKEIETALTVLEENVERTKRGR